MKKNYDFLGSGPLRSSQKAPEGPQPGRDPGDRGVQVSQGGPDCSELLKTSQKALQKRGILMKSKDPGSGSQDLDHQIWISELKKRYLGHPLESALAEP